MAVPSSQVVVVWGMRHNTFLWNGTTFMQRRSEAGRFSMRTQPMLLNATKRKDCHGVLNTSWGSSTWVGCG